MYQTPDNSCYSQSYVHSKITSFRAHHCHCSPISKMDDSQSLEPASPTSDDGLSICDNVDTPLLTQLPFLVRYDMASTSPPSDENPAHHYPYNISPRYIDNEDTLASLNASYYPHSMDRIIHVPTKLRQYFKDDDNDDNMTINLFTGQRRRR